MLFVEILRGLETFSTGGPVDRRSSFVEILRGLETAILVLSGLPSLSFVEILRGLETRNDKKTGILAYKVCRDP